MKKFINKPGRAPHIHLHDVGLPWHIYKGWLGNDKGEQDTWEVLAIHLRTKAG